MQTRERLGNQVRGERGVELDAPRAKRFGETPHRLPFEVLHDEHVTVGRFVDFVRVHDVRMVEARGEARLVEEHLHERRIFAAVTEALDDDEFVEPRRTGRGT